MMKSEWSRSKEPLLIEQMLCDLSIPEAKLNI